MLRISITLFCISFAFAENIPALIWSPSRHLSDLPQSYAGHTIGTNNFLQDFLKPLVADGKHNVVVFLQDKLSLEDFTTHADVYNPDGDGGVFKNVKTAMDDQFSVHLPMVKKPVVAIDSLVKGFTGDVHKVDNSGDIQLMDLSADKSNLILVTLPPTRGKADSTAFTENDNMMGRCMHHLNKRGVEYSAIYTAAYTSQSEPESGYQGRHLLADAAAPDNDTCVFVKEEYGENKTHAVFLYLCSVGIEVTKSKGTPTTFEITAKYLNVTVDDNGKNGTNITLALDNTKMTVEITMTVLQKQAEWHAMDGYVTFISKNDSTFNVPNATAVGLEVVTAPDFFCFHCSKLVAKSRTDPNITNRISVTLNSFQFDPFGNSSINATFTDNVWDCVPFFSAPIWMAIITGAILLLILFFGLTMITNIKTMDRFDDPKGKTVTVTVNE